MIDLSKRLSGLTKRATPGPAVTEPRVAADADAIGGEARLRSLASLFPGVTFEAADAKPDPAAPAPDILIIGAHALSHAGLQAVLNRLRASDPQTKVVVVLDDADVTTTRALIREGVADVLPAPVSDPTLALCIERLLSQDGLTAGRGGAGGEIVAVLKAGGGVGATALATQTAVKLAAQGQRVCVADLDLQFGAVSLYLDQPRALTLTDCLQQGNLLQEDTSLAQVLAKHDTGVHLLAAPADLTPLEAIGPGEIETLAAALRRNFAVTLLDLPSVWTAWTSHALSLADRIVIVTRLTVPHVNLVKRQLRTLATQGLSDTPVILACNGVSMDQRAAVTVKAAERAMGRAFDVLLPDDVATMTAAINQGVPLATVRRGTKLEKAIGEFANKIAAVPATAAGRGR